jgi:hypothetical protein
MYKMYLRAPTYVSASKLLSSGFFFSRQLQELFTFNYTVNGYTLQITHHTYVIVIIHKCINVQSRSQWPRGLRRGSVAARLLGLWVRIPLEPRMSVSCECCVLSGRGLCVGLVTRPEKSYRVWCVWVWSRNLEKWGGLGPLGAVEQ